MHYKIRRAEYEDAADLAALHVRIWRQTYLGVLPAPLVDNVTVGRELRFWRAATHRQEVDLDNIILVAETDVGEIVGFGVAGRARDERGPWDGEITMLYVDRPHQRHGIGKALMRAMADHLLSRALFSAGLWVVERNQRARRFYESLAGRPSGTRDERMQGFLVPVSAYAWEEAAELAGRTVVRH